MAARVIMAVNARNLKAEEKLAEENQAAARRKARRTSTIHLEQALDEVLTEAYGEGNEEQTEEERNQERRTRVLEAKSPREIAYMKYEHHMMELGNPKVTCCGLEAPMRFKREVYVLYNGNTIQLLVAALIMVNFVVNAAEAQVKELPLEEGEEVAKKEGQAIFDGFEVFFTTVFTIELIANMYAHWCWEFWNSGWNLFDFVVVLVSLLTTVFPGMPGIGTLRLMRAFRVFRLFKRLASLRKILKALENAVPGCANAFAIVVLVNAIFSILGVEFFKDGASKAYFKNFSVSMFTLFQVMTGDSWSEAIARPIIDEYPHAAIYFITYILLVGIVLVNVVIAVLLEKMVDGGEDDEGEDWGWLDTMLDKEEEELKAAKLTAKEDDEEEEYDYTLNNGEDPMSAPEATYMANPLGTDNGNKRDWDDSDESADPVTVEMKRVDEDADASLDVAPPPRRSVRTKRSSIMDAMIPMLSPNLASIPVDLPITPRNEALSRRSSKLSSGGANAGAGGGSGGGGFGGGGGRGGAATERTSGEYSRKPRRESMFNNLTGGGGGHAHDKHAGKAGGVRGFTDSEFATSHLILHLIQKVDSLAENVAYMKDDLAEAQRLQAICNEKQKVKSLEEALEFLKDHGLVLPMYRNEDSPPEEPQ